MFSNSKPAYRLVRCDFNESFKVKIDAGANLSNEWHYHPELELNLIQQSSGVRIVGSHVDRFGDGDLIFIGENLPHAFLHDPGDRVKTDCHHSKAIVIQFYESFMGRDFLNLPELKQIQQLFLKAKMGLKIDPRVTRQVAPFMESIVDAEPLDRIVLLMQILSILCRDGACNALNEMGSLEQAGHVDDRRIYKILDYTNCNYGQNIKIEEVAKLVNLTKESFCRYFKSITKRTYLEFLTEVRIKNACKMILESSMSIKEIGYLCGFDSLSNFHYQFKKITDKSPKEFRFMMNKKMELPEAC